MSIGPKQVNNYIGYSLQHKYSKHKKVTEMAKLQCKWFCINFPFHGLKKQAPTISLRTNPDSSESGKIYD